LFEKKQSFLAIDIGTGFVRGFGVTTTGTSCDNYLHTESRYKSNNSIATTIDAIEEKLHANFDQVFVTGNFGIVQSIIGRNVINFPNVHRVNDSDVFNAIFNSPEIRNIFGQTLHIIPLQLLVNGQAEAKSTENILCNNLNISFNCITYPNEIIDDIKKDLTSACIPPVGFFDPIYMLGQTYQSKNNCLFIDFGKTTTKVGLFKKRGMTSRFDIEIGQDEITKEIEKNFCVSYESAEDMKLKTLSSPPAPSDTYVLADEKNQDVTRFDVWETWTRINSEIINRISERLKTDDFDLFITGGGSNCNSIQCLILENLGIDKMTVLSEFAIVGTFGKMFKTKFIPKKSPIITQKRNRFVPILPSIMCWNIDNAYIYKMFASTGISRIHCDIMDGFYTNNIYGSLDDLKKIKKISHLGMHVHLMVDDPLIWCDKVAEAGAETILVSTGSRNVVEALKRIKILGKRCGLALHPNFNLKNIRPELLNMLDEIMIMAVEPGASGQEFLPETITRIKILANSRKKYCFKYKITVDGGINDDTAPECWNAGADILISGNYLHRAPDFADAVLKLMPRK
jgi:ribulose-phosphate 3-epimerase